MTTASVYGITCTEWCKFTDLDENNEIECVAFNPNSYCGMEYECTDYPSDNRSPLNFD